jgi:hypothetical protein
MFEMGGAGIVEVCRKAAREDVSVASDDELLAAALELEDARSAVDAAEAHVLAELEARGTCDRELGLSTVSWLADRARLPRRVASSRVRVATKLRGVLGEVDDALREGTIRYEHAQAVAGDCNPRIEPEIAQRQGTILTRAAELPFLAWRRELGALAELLDQDGGYDPTRDLAKNRLSFAAVAPDHVLISGELVGDAALVVTEAIQREADRVFRTYRDDHDTTGGDTPLPSRATCMALALVELCRHGTAATNGPGTVADVTLVLEADGTLRTSDGGRLLAERYAHLTCDAAFYALVIDSLGVPLDLGHEVRYANRAQRRALARRDGGCAFPGCGAPASWCDAHHVTHHEHGGPTDIRNLVLLCRHHHGLTHRQGWTLVANDDQTFTWTSPSGRSLHSQRHGDVPPGAVPL